MKKSTKGIRVAPAILEESMRVVQARMESVAGLVPFVQVDICDGKFVPSKTVGTDADMEEFATIGQLAKDAKLGLELDMMVKWSEVDKWLSAIEAAAPGAVVLHYGSVQDADWAKVVEGVKTLGAVVGLAVHIDTPLAEAIELAKQHDFAYVQVMGIERVGYGGQEFSPKALEIIKELHRELPGVMVSVDGGVNLNTIESIKRAGVEQVAAGSAIFNAENKEEVIRLLAT